MVFFSIAKQAKMCKNKIRKNKQFQPRERYDIMEFTRVRPG
jgi:hypothetical protein